MREIKFRAYLEPRYDEDDQAGMYYDVQRSYDTLADVKPCDIMTSFNSWLNEEHATVEQYVGLKDKNGKEIYEGDILLAWGKYYKVVFDSERVGFVAERVDGIKDSFFGKYFGIYLVDHCEVIGNIHENPELLEANNVD